MQPAAALLAALLAAPCASAAAASVAQGFHVRVDLNASTGMRLEAAPAAATVPATGPVTVPNALVIRTFRAHALRLRLEVVDPAVKSVDVLGLGKPVHIEHGGKSVLVPSAGKDGTRTLSYVVSYVGDGRARGSVPLLATVMP